RTVAHECSSTDIAVRLHQITIRDRHRRGGSVRDRPALTLLSRASTAFSPFPSLSSTPARKTSPPRPGETNAGRWLWRQKKGTADTSCQRRHATRVDRGFPNCACGAPGGGIG